MSSKTKTILLLAVLVLFISGGLVAYNMLNKNVTPENPITSSAKPTPITENEEAKKENTAPDFKVIDSNGNTVSLSDYFGKPIVLNFWASWCSPCKGEMPEFNKVYEEMKDTVMFMMVDMVGGRETKEKGQQYVKEQGFSFPVFYDVKEDAAYTYGISSIPTTVFINKEGILVTSARSAIDEKTLRKGIDMIIN